MYLKKQINVPEKKNKLMYLKKQSRNLPSIWTVIWIEIRCRNVRKRYTFPSSVALQILKTTMQFPAPK